MDIMRHLEKHRTQRIVWLRASLLGANDGIASTASLVVGVAAANASQGSIFITGVAGLVAGAMTVRQAHGSGRTSLSEQQRLRTWANVFSQVV